LIQYLQADAVRLLRVRYGDDVGSTLLSAVAEAVQLAAWMTYDGTPGSPQAQRYFIQALGLAQAGTGCPARQSVDSMAVPAQVPSMAAIHQTMAGTTASIRWGPGSVSARDRCLTSSSHVSACAAGTPMDWASPVKSSAAPPRLISGLSCSSF